MERAFKICAEGKGDELTKDQLFNYLCALGNPSQFAPQRTSQLPFGNSLSAPGLTPTQAEVDSLPSRADLGTAKAKYEELYSDDRAFTEVCSSTVRLGLGFREIISHAVKCGRSK